MRPITELEFEKACRGPLDPVQGEYAWGTPSYTVISGLQGADGSGQEYYTTGNLLCSGSSPGGPARVGMFARPGSTREAAGASYWGIMDLSGNIWERCIIIGHATGRAFTGEHGAGTLSAIGDANVAGWPNTTATGAGFRGGCFLGAVASSRVSDRNSAAAQDAQRAYTYGGRVGRSAP